MHQKIHHKKLDKDASLSYTNTEVMIIMNSYEAIRITATLPAAFIDELKTLVNSKQIPSVNFAIKQAVDEYLKQIKKNQYEAMMKEAAADKAFMSRTSKCNEDFAFADSEVDSEW